MNKMDTHGSGNGAGALRTHPALNKNRIYKHAAFSWPVCRGTEKQKILSFEHNADHDRLEMNCYLRNRMAGFRKQREHITWCAPGSQTRDLPSLLIADADEQSRQHLIESLPVFCRVICTDDSMEALELLHQYNFDLIICDSQLPPAGGIDLLRQVKKHHPETWTLYVLKEPNPGLASLALRWGAIDCVIKPVCRALITILLSGAPRN